MKTMQGLPFRQIAINLFAKIGKIGNNRKILPKIAITTAKFYRKLRLQPQNSTENCDYNRKILPKIAI